MIEITILVFLILLLIKPLAKERGENLSKWVFITVGVWFGTEVIVGAAILLILRWRGIQISEADLLIVSIPMSVTLNLFAAIATYFVIRALRKKPIPETPTAPAEQLT